MALRMFIRLIMVQRPTLSMGITVSLAEYWAEGKQVELGIHSYYAALHWVHCDLCPLKGPTAVTFPPAFTISLTVYSN